MTTPTATIDLDILLSGLAPDTGVVMIERHQDAIAILEGVDTTQLTANNFESV